ncbi:hypothetical protein QYM36_013038 [Artemia franciscana]|uniref:EF-hand domain-containing protein n=1 Tax=Artemia franciscana TaxID=6661 RepID=A0AA88HKF5_ARTSF|nr:hypothetical protein QYM36_013038 [Artemia franciscana]
MNLLYKISQVVQDCLTDIASNGMLHKKHYYDAIIEKNNYCMKYSGFLPSIFNIEDVKNLETEKNSDTEEVKKALDKMYDSQESDESEDAFKQMDVSKEGNLTMEEVIKGLKLEDTRLMRHVLSIFDKDKNNIFDLNEFKVLYGTILSKEAYYVFQVLDFDRDGIISRSDIFRLCKIIPKRHLGTEVKNQLKVEIGKIIPEKGGLNLKDFEPLFKKKNNIEHNSFENINRNVKKDAEDDVKIHMIRRMQNDVQSNMKEDMKSNEEEEMETNEEENVDGNSIFSWLWSSLNG